MADPRYVKVPRQRHDGLQGEIDKLLHENPDLVAHARYISELMGAFIVDRRANGHRAPWPSLSTLRRRFARSVMQRRTANDVNRVRARFAATTGSPAVRLPVEDPARGFRRLHARPVLYMDVYTGAIISTP